MRGGKMSAGKREMLDKMEAGEICHDCKSILSEAEQNYCAYWNHRTEAIRYGEKQPVWLCRECQRQHNNLW